MQLHFASSCCCLLWFLPLVATWLHVAACGWTCTSVFYSVLYKGSVEIAVVMLHFDRQQWPTVRQQACYLGRADDLALCRQQYCRCIYGLRLGLLHVFLLQLVVLLLMPGFGLRRLQSCVLSAVCF